MASNRRHDEELKARLKSMPKSQNVRKMTQIINNIVSNIDKRSADYTERCNLAVLLLRMYTDLDKTVRRCDESGTRSKWGNTGWRRRHSGSLGRCRDDPGCRLNGDRCHCGRGSERSSWRTWQHRCRA
jgi:hypothetical protein